jgi:hypothetical protein
LARAGLITIEVMRPAFAFPAQRLIYSPACFCS